tara:strand:+ start:156 stop:665 length:510 start_codon:yes stop_codon:yes gene_type:complete
VSPVDRKEKSGSVDHHDIEQFLFMEAKLLDQKRFNEWADLFCEDGTYWIPTEEEQVDPYSHASIIFDDKQSMMARIRRLGHPMIHAQSPPSRTTHIVTNIMTDLRMDKKEEFLVDACFTMFEYRDDEQLMYGGRYTYNLKILGGLLLIDKKIVKLVNSDAAHNIMAVYI